MNEKGELVNSIENRLPRIGFAADELHCLGGQTALAKMANLNKLICEI